jgi:hypothetical protein
LDKLDDRFIFSLYAIEIAARATAKLRSIPNVTVKGHLGEIFL